MKIIGLLLIGSTVCLNGQAQTPTPPVNTVEMNYKTCSTSECHSNVKNKKFIHSPLKADGCYLCHVPIMRKHKFTLFPDNVKMCTDCHDDIDPSNIHKEDKIWLLKFEGNLFSTHPLDFNIHEDLYKKLISSGIKPHEGKLTCLSCHDPHRSENSHILRDIKSQGGQAKLCFQCHEENFAPASHPMKENKCFDCHRFHKGKEKTPLMKFNKKTQDISCFECHKEKKALLKTKHDLDTWTKPLRENALPFIQKKTFLNHCQLCHDVHHSKTQANLLNIETNNETSNKLDLLCLNCHKNSKFQSVTQIPHTFTHVPILITSTVDSSGKEIFPRFYTSSGGEITSTESAVHLSCATCHDPHIWSQTSSIKKTPEGDLRSSFLIESKTILKFCATCHGQEAFTLYTQFHTHQNKEEKANVKK